MVNPVNKMVNRVDVQKTRDIDVKSGGASARPVEAPTVSKDSVKVSDAASPQRVADISARAPIDSEAVSRIKDAIAQGKYPIDLDQISDALMDAYRELKA